ncbi:hypothetical protein Tco_1095146 [Tanacetum coccineum]
MCIRQGYMIQCMEKKYVTDSEFWKVHGKVDKVLHEIIPQIAEKATNDVIEGNLKRIVVDTIIQERDALQAEVIQVHPIISLSTSTTSSTVLQQQLYLKMKFNLQDQVADPELWDVLKRDAHPEGEKRAKIQKTSKSLKSLKSARSSSSKQSGSTYAYELQQQKLDWDAWIEPQVINEDGGNVRKEFKIFNEEAWLSIHHWKDSWHKRRYKLNQRRVRDNPEEYFSNQRIIEVFRITIDQQHRLDYMEQIIMMRENDKPNSFSKAEFKYLNKNDIEDLYYLYLNKKLRIESYQIRENLTALTLTFPGIEAHDLTLIRGQPKYRVLKEVKLKIFKYEPWKKPPQLGELDLDILKALEREIRNRLRHHVQMKRWESFMNGRPILPAMRRP